MEPLFVATGIVALAEIGDKTQLLSLLLAARFRQPWPIVVGILIATLANHIFAGAAGIWIATVLGRDMLRWGLGLAFLAMALWTMIPDRVARKETAGKRFGVLGMTVIAFFLAEMGDKTQIATVVLAARYDSFVAVVAGTTLGMMVTNVPTVLLGDKFAERMPVRLVRGVAASVFAVLGVLAILNGSEAI